MEASRKAPATINPAALRLSAFYGAVFLFLGAHMPFWPVWLESRGLAPAEIGFALATGMWVRIAAGPLVAAAAERLGGRRGALLALCAAACVAFAAFAGAEGFWPIAALTALFTLFWGPVIPLGDALAMSLAYARRLDYGRVRLWGSITFILAALAGGQLLSAAGPDAVWALLVAALALSSAIAWSLPREPGGTGRRSFAGGFALLRRRPFLLLLAASGLLQASHAMLYGFGTLEWRRLGVADGVIGGLWAEAVIAEILLFAASGAVVARLGVGGLLAAACFAGLVRWTAMAFEPGAAWLLLLQPLHAFTFGATHLAAMHFLARFAPEHAGLAQVLHAAVGVGLAMALSTSAAGPLYAALGPLGFLPMAGLSALGGLAALALVRVWDGRRLAL